MRRQRGFGVYAVVLLALATAQRGAAQDGAANSLDSAIDQIRTLNEISEGDRQRIERWIQFEVERLAAAASEPGAALKAFRNVFQKQRTHSGNTPAFRSQFAAITGTAAAASFKSNAHPTVHTALARILEDFDAVETVEGLIAGLACPTPAARYLSANALAKLSGRMSSQAETRTRVQSALTTAGRAEADPVVMRSIFDALTAGAVGADAVGAINEVFSAYLAKIRDDSTMESGASLPVLRYFATALPAMTPAQRPPIVANLAIVLQLAVSRISAQPATAEATPILEEMAWRAEELLEVATGQRGGVRDALSTGDRPALAAKAVEWYGSTEGAGVEGILNKAPWNVPKGAP